MAAYSQYKNLELPVNPEHYDINVFNKNNMVIDSELHKLDLKNESQDNLLATKEALNSEISRATNKENEISGEINSEINRAVTSEEAIQENLSLLISELTVRLNTLADSDDTTLDQLSEIVAYIKNNKDLIDGVTTSKVNVSDIIDNLTSTAANKPLSANQGKVLKELINSLTKDDIGLGNVENKSSATIRSELTKENITTALGYTPQQSSGISYSASEPTSLFVEMTWIGN